jgi:hypothetical protein
MLALLAGACSNQVDVSFRLVPSASDPTLLSGADCSFIEVVVAALDPNDPLYLHKPDGPRRTTCQLAEGNCKINGAELIGTGRLVDVLCKPSVNVDPVARATSQSLLFDDSRDGVDGLRATLQLGRINEFSQATVIDPDADDFTEVSLMAESAGRYGHASVVLEDGRVLITGGIRRFGQSGVEEILATAEIFDPATGSHRLVLGPDGAAKMAASSGRAYHTMTRLRDGRVLIAGGVGMIDKGGVTERAALRSAEIFDPATETFVSPMDMGAGRAHHAATMLATGSVLLTGGATYGGGTINNYLDNGVIFNPTDASWTPVANTMSAPRAFHQAVLLDPATTQGKVLVVGGENSGGTLNSVDIFNPNGLQFYAGVDVAMGTNRSRFCAVRLSSGRVMVAGGSTERDDPGTPDREFSPDTGVEIYDPVDPSSSFGAFTADTINLQVARMDHSCHLLDTGHVLVAGGITGGGQATGLGEIVRDDNNAYSVEQIPNQLDPARGLHGAVRLRNGWVLLTGGLANLEATSAMRESVFFVPPPSYQ